MNGKVNDPDSNSNVSVIREANPPERVVALALEDAQGRTTLRMQDGFLVIEVLAFGDELAIDLNRKPDVTATVPLDHLNALIEGRPASTMLAHANRLCAAVLENLDEERAT